MMASFPAAEDRATPPGGAAAVHLPGIRRPRSNASVRLFNVRFSPNLGDGLLAECLEQALVECGAGQDTWSVDLAARAGYAPGSTSRPAQLRLLDALPPPLRRLSVRLPLALRSRLTWRPHYRRALEGADCAVIGGGNLLADLDLNFPTKIALAVDEAARRGIPAFIYACGVDGNWSRPARRLLDRALRKGTIRRVFVRDERSRQAWNELAGTACDLEATLVRDPGLLAAVRYGIVHQPRPGEAPVIGINVTCPIALRYHAGPDAVPEALDSWYLSLACALAGRGAQVVLFTNGSPEDRAYLRWLHPTFAALAGRVSFPDPRTPEELVHVIAGLDGLAAFRMHAVIAAYSCGVPFLALAWDTKLEAFAQSVDRAGWLCHPATTPPDRAAVRLLAAMREGIPDDERERVIRQTRRGVAMLQDQIARSLR